MQELPPQTRIVSTPYKGPRRLSKPRSPRKSMKRASAKKKKRSGPKTVLQLMKELDILVSLFVRLSNADKEGLVQCFTCRRFFHYKKIHNGHYVSRFYKQTRWDERNLRPQCPICNLWKRGDPVTFRELLVEEYGETIVRELEESRNVSNKLDRDYLVEQIALYTDKVASARTKVIE